MFRHDKIQESQVEEIISLYQQGKTTDQIGSMYKVSRHPIWMILKEYNIERRDRRFSARKNFFNESYFENIDTPEKAYLLGCIFTDGNNYLKRNRVHLGMNDGEVINFFKNEIEYKKEPIQKIAPSGKTFYEVAVCSKKMSQDLLEKGVVNKKSQVLKYPVSILKKEFEKFFILGCFDGDGWITKPEKKYYQWGFCGTRDMCEGVSNFLFEELGIRLPLRVNSTIFSIATQRATSVKIICDYLYKDAPFFMIRKNNLYKEFKEKYANLYI